MTSVRCMLMGLLLAAGSATPAPAEAQEETSRQQREAEKESNSGWTARLRELQARGEEAVETLHRRGIYPEVGSIVSGSGIAGGVSLRHPSFGGSAVGGEFDAMWSVRGYQSYVARVGLVARSRDTLRLERADSNLTGLFNANASTRPGVASYLVVSHHHSAQVDFFGLGASTPGPKTDFAVSARSLDLVAQWQPTRRIGFAARAGVLKPDLGPGAHDAVRVLDAHFDTITSPELLRQPSFLTIGVAAAADTRDAPRVPTKGAFVGLAVWRFVSLGRDPTPFTRVALDTRVYWTLASPRHVAAIRLLAAGDSSPQDRPTPFYLQYWLGGSHSLRGFSSYQFRGEALVHASVEYRWRLLRMLDVAPFVDAGTVATGFTDLARSTIHVTPGVSLGVRDDKRVFFRVDWAHGRDGHRVISSFSPSF